eukprot:CFRG8510T1
MSRSDSKNGLDATSIGDSLELHTSKHVAYLAAFGKSQDDYEYHMSEHLRMSGVYWSLTALALCKSLRDSVDVDEISSFVMSCQHPNGGFGAAEGHDPHMLFTLSAVQILVIIDRLDLVDKELVARYIGSLQQSDGSFCGDEWGEVDTRFSFCALSCLSLLGFFTENASEAERSTISPQVYTSTGLNPEFTKIKSDLIAEERVASNIEDVAIEVHAGITCEYADIDKAVQFVLTCRNFDGGFGCLPGSESHAGQIYCCLGVLAITKSLDHIDADLLGWWLAERQIPGGGLNGRPEKLPDVCYSWWVLASLKMIDRHHWINRERLSDFILQCQDLETGGFADRPGNMPDPFHTLFGLAGLRMLDKANELDNIDHIYCLPARVMERLGDTVPVKAEP